MIEPVIVARSEPIEVEAVPTIELVFPFTTAAREVEAVVTVVFTLDVAELMSTFVASEPVVSPAPVSVRVTLLHTFVGTEVIELVIVASKEPIEDEAVFVTLLTLAATEVDAVVTVVESVPI